MPGCLDGLPHPGDLVGWQIVHDDDVARPQFGDERLLNIGEQALVQIAGAGKRPVFYCRDFKLGARHSTLQAQVDLGHPDVPV